MIIKSVEVTKPFANDSDGMIKSLEDYELAAYGRLLSPDERRRQLPGLEQTDRTSYLGAHLDDGQANLYAEAIRQSLDNSPLDTAA